ncbi:hypothetical protein J4573_13055 [Actinomadura barringtoniae]|uniref:DUF6286 domain-containing protein n=1 Tax=Actinomadura barringtoniae TaxID=1427535 RepID=A0A939P8W9_9ACTN|nr:DUF6286 domain-containing protein [Actinomadura barringtoniae]MBO2448025.1 hypothetical protein [Actinomadura barringtoniae]
MGETLITDLMGEAEVRQRARRLAVQEFRPRRSAVGLVTGLAVTLAGTVVAAEALTLTIGLPRWNPAVQRLVDILRRTDWNSPWVLLAAGVMVLTGVLLLVAALPGRPRPIALRGGDPRVAGALARSAMQRVLMHAALDVPGVDKAKVRLRGRSKRRRRVVVWAGTGYRNPANLADLVRTSVIGRMGGVGLMNERYVVVRLSWRKD